MAKPVSEADRSMLMKKPTELSRTFTASAAELAQLQTQISKMPTTAAGLESEFGLSGEDATAALTRLQTVEQVVDNVGGSPTAEMHNESPWRRHSECDIHLSGRLNAVGHIH